MDDNVPKSFKYLREISARVYFNWLIKMDIIQQFSKPETIPGVFYNLNLPSSQGKIYEEIFRFLESFNIVKEAGGTYILSKPLEKLKPEYSIIEKYKEEPIFNFLNYGLSLLEDLLEGGTGSWDLETKNYLFERGYIQATNEVYDEHISSIINPDRFLISVEKPKIAIYGSYPDLIIPRFFDLFPNTEDKIVITPNERLKLKCVTYCEIDSIAQEYSMLISSESEVKEEEYYDIIFVPNGLGFYKKLSEHLNFFKNILTKHGYLIFRSTTKASNMTGIEPLFTLHKHSYPLPFDKEFERILKSNGFTDLRYLSASDIIGYAQREDKIV